MFPTVKEDSQRAVLVFLLGTAIAADNFLFLLLDWLEDDVKEITGPWAGEEPLLSVSDECSEVGGVKGAAAVMVFTGTVAVVIS